jgi:hypothetical protein
MKYGVCILCDRMKEEEDSRGKGPINGNTCQCPDALTCEHCKDKDTDVTSEDDKYNIHRFVYVVCIILKVFIYILVITRRVI